MMYTRLWEGNVSRLCAVCDSSFSFCFLIIVASWEKDDRVGHPPAEHGHFLTSVGRYLRDVMEDHETMDGRTRKKIHKEEQERNTHTHTKTCMFESIPTKPTYHHRMSIKKESIIILLQLKKIDPRTNL